MARIRTIKPEFWDDEKMAAVSRDARLLFVGMLNFAEDNGVIKGHTSWIRSRIFPYDVMEPSQVEGWLKELEAIRAIIPFTDSGEKYFFIRNFVKHQKIDKPNKNPSNPEPPEGIGEQSASPPHLFGEDSANIPRKLPEDSENIRCGNGMEGKGMEWSRNGGEGTGGDFSGSGEPVSPVPEDVSPSPEVPDGNGNTKCPHTEILALYHETLPFLPKVRKFTPELQKHIRARWREDPQRQNLEWWKLYFTDVGKSDYLTGKVNSFQADFEWLVGPKNMTKILNGRYANRGSPDQAGRHSGIQEWLRRKQQESSGGP